MAAPPFKVLPAKLGASYQATKDIYVRGGIRYSTITHKFNGSGELTDRDNDGTPDVQSAADTTLGLNITAGYLF